MTENRFDHIWIDSMIERGLEEGILDYDAICNQPYSELEKKAEWVADKLSISWKGD